MRHDTLDAGALFIWVLGIVLMLIGAFAFDWRLGCGVLGYGMFWFGWLRIRG